MRRREFHGSDDQGTELFATLPVMQLAGVDAEGQPVLRTLNGVVDDGWVCFHGSPAGEKTDLLGRPVVVAVEETVARIPSYFMDPEKACPATTLYRSAQVHGTLQRIDEPVRKARVLQKLMEKLQPEGGYVPLDHDSPMYRAAVKGILIAGLPLAGFTTTKLKLAQNKKPEEQQTMMQKLWERGERDDARAIELIRAANPTTAAPKFLEAPEGMKLHAWLPERFAREARAMLKPEYWNDQFSEAQLEAAHVGANAWVGITDDVTGELLATARAISDGAKYAWVYDVCVRKDQRRRGLGQLVMKLLLDHPAVRRCAIVRLGTKDAQSLYRRFGFVATSELPPRPYATTEMLLKRTPSEPVRLLANAG
ncbi:MAG: GNAT family N-acetyltransferase [Archangium sp.]